MDFPSLIREPDKKARSLVRKLTHSGEMDLEKQQLMELREICKASEDLIIVVSKECIKCLQKDHSQVRVATVKLIDYLFRKSHVFREQLLNRFDIFLELTLAITQKPKVKLKLPPPKKYAELLKELTAKSIHKWHADFGGGYEKIRYAYKYLREHQLVDFSQFRVQTHEDLIKQRKLAERQDKILTLSIENRLKDFKDLKPEIEEIIAQIESLIDMLVPAPDGIIESNIDPANSALVNYELLTDAQRQHHGITNLTQNVDIEFSPFLEVRRNTDNKEIVQNLKELKKQLVMNKLTRLIAIEKTLIRRSEQLVNTLKDIIDLKSKTTNLILKLGELRIVNHTEDGQSKKASVLDDVDSESDENSDFEDVEPKEDLETYIPKSMRHEYGLEAIDPKELSNSNKITLTDESFSSTSTDPCCSSSLVMACNVRLENGRLCTRRDKIKCPFHGKIIPRDHNGMPLDRADRLKEEEMSKSKTSVPDWQDPQLLMEIEAATGVDLKMPGKCKSRNKTIKRLENTKVCDLTPKQRLERRLKRLAR